MKDDIEEVEVVEVDRLSAQLSEKDAEIAQYRAVLVQLVEEATCADWSGETPETVFATAQMWCGKYHQMKQELDGLRAQLAEKDQRIRQEQEYVSELAEEHTQMEKRLTQLAAQGEPLHVIFDGPPGPESGRFVECETANGRSVSAGEWSRREDGLWQLIIPGRITAQVAAQQGAFYHSSGGVSALTQDGCCTATPGYPIKRIQYPVDCIADFTDAPELVVIRLNADRSAQGENK